jgi:TPR repeat protein
MPCRHSSIIRHLLLSLDIHNTMNNNRDAQETTSCNVVDCAVCTQDTDDTSTAPEPNQLADPAMQDDAINASSFVMGRVVEAAAAAAIDSSDDGYSDTSDSEVVVLEDDDPENNGGRGRGRGGDQDEEQEQEEATSVAMRRALHVRSRLGPWCVMFDNCQRFVAKHSSYTDESEQSITVVGSADGEPDDLAADLCCSVCQLCFITPPNHITKAACGHRICSICYERIMDQTRINERVDLVAYTCPVCRFVHVNPPPIDLVCEVLAFHKILVKCPIDKHCPYIGSIVGQVEHSRVCAFSGELCVHGCLVVLPNWISQEMHDTSCPMKGKPPLAPLSVSAADHQVISTPATKRIRTRSQSRDTEKVIVAGSTTPKHKSTLHLKFEEASKPTPSPAVAAARVNVVRIRYRDFTTVRQRARLVRLVDVYDTLHSQGFATPAAFSAIEHAPHMRFEVHNALTSVMETFKPEVIQYTYNTAGILELTERLEARMCLYMKRIRYDMARSDASRRKAMFRVAKRAVEDGWVRTDAGRYLLAICFLSRWCKQDGFLQCANSRFEYESVIPYKADQVAYIYLFEGLLGTYAPATRTLAVMLLRDIKSSCRTRQIAFQMLKNAAERHNHGPSMHDIGALIQARDPVAMDEGLVEGDAIMWFERGVQRVHVGCMIKLADIYRRGWGDSVAANQAMALSYYEEAARCGCQQARFKLRMSRQDHGAVCVEHLGLSVARDWQPGHLAETFEWPTQVDHGTEMSGCVVRAHLYR